MSGPRSALPHFQPLDISNGKAVFKKHQHIQYNSITQKKWIDVQVIFVREDGAVCIDLKDRHYFSVEDQKTKFREHRRCWHVNDELQYKSASHGNVWMDCVVVALSPKDDSVQISCKAGYWMDVEEQDEKLRLPVFGSSNVAAWEAEELLKKSPPRYEEAAQKLRTVLEDEPDHTQAMQQLATLLRDYYKDYAGAEELYRKVLDENPYDSLVLSDLSDLLKYVGKKDEGKEIRERWRKVWDKLRDLQIEEQMR